MKKALFSKLFFLLLLGIDVLTKAIALRFIPNLQGSTYPFGGIGVFENVFGVSFSLNRMANTGIAWGVFPDHFALLLSFRILIVLCLFIYLIFSLSKNRSNIPLWLIVTGAIGNIVDMLSYGYVVDFIHFQFLGWSFPVFNVADSCITMGVALLLFWPCSSKRCSG